jgi:hypothetical protein
MKIHSVGAESVHEDTQTYVNGWIDITKPTVAFRKSLYAPINK